MAKVKNKLIATLLVVILCISSVTANAASHSSLFVNKTYLAEGSVSSVGYDNTVSVYAGMIDYSVKATVQTYTKLHLDGEYQEVIANGRTSNVVNTLLDIDWNNDFDGYLITKAEFSYFYGVRNSSIANTLAGQVTLVP